MKLFIVKFDNNIINYINYLQEQWVVPRWLLYNWDYFSLPR